MRAISNLDKPEENSNICNTEMMLPRKIKKIRIIEDVSIYEPEEKVNHSYAKSMVKPIEWKPLVLPFIQSSHRNNLYESMETEPSRNKHNYSKSICTLKSLNEVDKNTGLTKV